MEHLGAAVTLSFAAVAVESVLLPVHAIRKMGIRKIAESFFICCLYLSDKKNPEEFKEAGIRE